MTGADLCPDDGVRPHSDRGLSARASGRDTRRADDDPIACYGVLAMGNTGSDRPSLESADLHAARVLNKK